jgi:hypothetical protein
MPPRPYILAKANWQAVSQTRFDAAVLPWGATEAHNYHLPYATDVIPRPGRTRPSGASTSGPFDYLLRSRGLCPRRRAA